MSDFVSVASNAVSAYQRSLGTISNNIANVATDGYSRQEVVLVANPVAKVGNTYLGTGVMVDRIQRQYDTFVESNLRSSNSDLLSQEPMVNYANRAGSTGDIRQTLAAEDQDFRSRKARFTKIRLVRVDRYNEAYRSQSLRPYDELERWRKAGAPTPSAPPGLR